MAWSQLVEALLLLVGGVVLSWVWLSARRRDRRVAQALRLSEERFRHLTSLSADWFWETDAEHRISWLSGGAAVPALFGDQLLHGKRLWEIPGVEVEPRALVDHFRRLREIDAQMPFFDFVISRGAAGAEGAHVVIGKPHYDAAGRFLGYRGIGQDITEKRRAERALTDAKERLQLALEGSGASLWDTDVRSGEVFVSESWSEFLGRPRTPTRTTVEDLKQMVHPEDLPRVELDSMQAVKGAVDEYAGEHRVQAAGGWRWVHSRGRVVERDPATGLALRMTGTILDITERKRAEQALRDAEARYRALIELAPDGVIVASGGIIEYANPAAVRLLKAGSAHRLLGTRTEQYIHPEHLERFRARRSHLFAGPGTISFEERRFVALDGSEVVVELAGVSYLERGRLVVQAVLRDVSEQRKARELLAEREQRFRDVLEASGEYVWETDADWRYTFLSERVETVLGYLRHEMIGRRPREFMPLGESQAMDEWFAARAGQSKGFRDLVHRSLAKSGRVVWQLVNGVPVHDAAGKLTGFRGTGADITARTLAEDRIRFLATHDPLTGLPNRVLLTDRAGQAILAAARSRGSLAVLCLDLDRFQLVNDSLGHAAGDALLRAIAERLGAALQRDDTLARIGGDEFVLLWNGLNSAHDPAALAQRAQAILARPFTIEGHTLNISASIGISVYPGDGRDFGELLKNAGTAANHAKETGRNRFQFFSPELNARAVARLDMENDLHGALSRGELLLQWQPVIGKGRGTAAGQLVGAEVLVRWQHPEKRLLMPDQFIAVAEDCGLIRQLGQWTLERALSQIGAWRRAGAEDIWFALNVSATELAEGNAYVDQLVAAMAANGVPGSCIELEITERVLMSHLEQNVETLRKLARHGVRIAIDDFGTGYSSLAYLRELPIDKLKIDRSFLRELDAHPADATIVQTIAAMAKALGLRVAAEGVESAAQLARLQALGCDEWQGYHFSAALDAPDFERLFHRKIALDGVAQMTHQFKYMVPIEETHWKFPASGEVAFTWDYDTRSEDLLKLYSKGKKEQWDADTRIDWSLPVDPEDPMQMADEVVPLYGTDLWKKLSKKQHAELRYHSQVFNLSQFLHGEQGALVCAARIVKDVPRIESKFYAATQVMDEARHVEAYRRLLAEKFKFIYPISKPLKTLLEQALNDPRWDFTYLGMQVLIEGLALVAFQRIRDYSKNPLCQAVNAYVMQDEARHVAFGRLALRDYYPELTDAERAEREEFVIEGSYHLRDRFNSPEMWEQLGFDWKEVGPELDRAEGHTRFKKRLFSRIVPTVRDIGLWSEKVQKAYTDLGGIQYAQTNAQEMLDNDAKVAEEFDRKMKEGFSVPSK